MLKRTLFFGNKCSLTTKNEQLVIKTDQKQTMDMQNHTETHYNEQHTHKHMRRLVQMATGG